MLRTDNSLVRLLVSIVLAVTVLVTGLQGAVDYWLRKQVIVEQFHQRAQQSLDELAQLVAPFVEAYALNEYDKLVANKLEKSGHFAIVITDLKMGEILGDASYVSGKLRDNGQIVDFDSKLAAHASAISDTYFSQSLSITSPRDGSRLGEVTVYEDDQALRQALLQALRSSLVTAFISGVLLVVLLIMALKRALLTPLGRITRAVERRDEQGMPLEAVPGEGFREVRILAGAMNGMVDAIRGSRDALSLERTRLANVIEGTNAGTWEWNIATGELQVNARWLENIGYTSNEMHPRGIDEWAALVHADDLQHAKQLLNKHFFGQLAYFECEVRMRHKHGQWVWMLERGRVSNWDLDGSPLVMSGTQQEITEQKRQALQLIENEARFRSIFEKNASVMLLIDPLAGNIVDANESALNYYGYPAQVFLGMSAYTLSSPEQLNLPCLAREPATLRSQHLLASGEKREVEAYSTPIMINDEVRLFFIVHDVTERVQAEKQLHLAASVFTHAREGIIITNPAGDIVQVNKAFSDITGYSSEEALGKNPSMLSSGRQLSGFYDAMWRELANSDHWQGELWNRRKDGSLYAEMLTLSAVRDNANAVVNYVGLFSDITYIKEKEQQLKQQAHYDVLTGLPNRVLLGDRLRQAMLQDAREQQVAVLFMDLDGFKAVNDTFGHEVGDQLLIALGERMKGVLRASDTLARMGGDEFVGVLTDFGSLNDSMSTVSRLLETVSKPVNLGGHLLKLTASLGVTFYPQDEDVDADQLLRQADQAMYAAKLSGKNRYHVFDSEQDRTLRGHNKLIHRIHQGIDEGEFVLFYQPKVDMREGRVIGFEALVRWQHPELGILPPFEFLPAIENHSLMLRMSDALMRQAVEQLSLWSMAGFKTSVSVNVAALQIQQADFVAKLKMLLSEFPLVEPSQLELEILETSTLDDVPMVSGVMRACRKLGVRFSLDDFGTGYSSLTYLKRLPAEGIKIDQSFVRDMHEDPDDLAIIDGVVSLADAFGRQLLAEGVETDEHGRLLLWLGCRYAQGYYIARPMPVADVVAWAKQWQLPDAWASVQPLSRTGVKTLFAAVDYNAWFVRLDAFLKDEVTETISCRAEDLPFLQHLGDGGVLLEAGFLAHITEQYTQLCLLADQLQQDKLQGAVVNDSDAYLQLHATHLVMLQALQQLIVGVEKAY